MVENSEIMRLIISTFNVVATVMKILSRIVASMTPFAPPPSKHNILTPESILGTSLKNDGI